jgi:hypothetical protein
VLGAASQADNSLDIISNHCNDLVVQVHSASSAPCLDIITWSDQYTSHKSSNSLNRCAIPLRVQGSNLVSVWAHSRGTRDAPKERADTQVCPYQGPALSSQLESESLEHRAFRLLMESRMSRPFLPNKKSPCATLEPECHGSERCQVRAKSRTTFKSLAIARGYYPSEVLQVRTL